jgi:hypothetical protein
VEELAQVEYLKLTPLKGRLFALHSIIRLAWKGLPKTNIHFSLIWTFIKKFYNIGPSFDKYNAFFQ